MSNSSSLINNNITQEQTHNYLYTSMVSHRGVPVSFAMRDDGHIFYSVLDMSNTEQNANLSTGADQNNDKNHWSQVSFGENESASYLRFPSEIMQVGYGIVPNFQISKYDDDNQQIIHSYDDDGQPLDVSDVELTEQDIKDKTNPFYSSTSRLGAQASFQVLSDAKYIYVFRQSIDADDPNNETPAIVSNTLLVDRFILSGTVLKLSREIRYQRSRHKTEPESPKDTLAAVDMEGNPFYEPTRELVFANNLSDGNFSVLLLPGADSEEQRWQIFTTTTDAETNKDKVNSFNIRFDYSIVFDMSDSQTVVNEFIERYGLDDSLVSEVQTKINDETNDGDTSDEKIASELLSNSPYSEKEIPQDDLAEVVYIIRTGVIKDDFELTSVSEWPLIEYESNSNTIKAKYTDEDGVLEQKYAFQSPTEELKPASASYNLARGLSSCYYYQQAMGADNKPMKNKACVMLALGLEDQNQSQNKYIGILNFSVAASGQLSRLTTDVVNMLDINVQALDENPYDTWEQIPTNNHDGVAWQEPQKMGLLDIDPNGLSTSGGVLKFAYTSADIGINAGYSDAVEATAPYLFDDSLGRVNLYFKGIQGNFFVLYFNPIGSKSLRVTDSSVQTAVPALSLKPRLDRDMSLNVVATVPNNTNTFTLSMTSQDVPVEEWKHLPRRFSQIADIFNGNGGLPLGTLEPLGNSDDPRAAYVKPQTGNGTFKLRTTTKNNLIFQDANAYAAQLADGAEPSVTLSDLSSYLTHNTTLNIANKQFSLVTTANVMVRSDIFYKSYLSGMVTNTDDRDKLWEHLKSQEFIQEVTGTTDRGNLKSASMTGTKESLSNAITDEKINDLSLELLQEGNEADKKSRRARLKQSLIALILDVAKVRSLTFTVQDANAQSVDRLEAGLEVSAVYAYESLFTCIPANLRGTSATEWSHFRSYLFNAEVKYDAETNTTTEINGTFNYQYEINNTIGQWEDWDASLAIEFDPESATNGALLNTEDSSKLEALQPTEKGLSIEAWVKPSPSFNTLGSILYYEKGGENYSLGIEKDPDDASTYKCVATLGDKKYISSNSFDFNNSEDTEGTGQWRHLAFTHKKYWGYKLNAGNTINCGNDNSLQLDGEFTIEVLVKIDTAGTLLKKTNQYSLSINSNNEIVFDWADTNCLEDNDTSGEKPCLDELERFYKITLIRSQNEPQPELTSVEYPITGNQIVCTLNMQYEGDEETEVEVTGLSSDVVFEEGCKFLVKVSTPDYPYGSIEIELTEEITGDGELQTIKIKPISLWGETGDSLERKKWYEDKSQEDIIRGMAQRQDQMNNIMKLAETNMFGNFTDQSSDPDPSYYHTLIVTDSDDNSTQWISLEAKKMERVEAFQDLIIGDDDFTGIFASVRIWNRALSVGDAEGFSLPENKAGLLSHWCMTEGKGKYLYDDVSENHGIADGGVWANSPANHPGQFQFYVDGVPDEDSVEETGFEFEPMDVDQFSVGGIKTSSNSSGEHFKGALEEIRIWNVPRTNEQITDNAFGRLKGEWEQLLANYTFDQPTKQTGNKVQDASVNSVHLEIQNATMLKEVLSTAPIATEIPQVRSALTGVLTEYNGTLYSRPGVVEYGDVQKNDDGTLNGILKRCYSFIDAEGRWNRMTGYKVGNLVSQWYGQAQFAPQVMGYLEGLPPVPGENFPISSDADVRTYAYSLNNSISFNQAEEVAYNYNTSKEAGWNVAAESEMEAGAGFEWIFAPMGFGMSGKLKAQVASKSNWETSGDRSQSYERGTSVNTDRAFSATMAGYDNGKSDADRYYKPGNTGYALVKSKTADIYLLRLAHNNALISISWQPNPDIPEDVNILPFPINPLYVKQGTLDGKFGETTDDHYPQAQNAYGQYSYFKPREAYQLKKQIDREKMELKAYFEDSFDTAKVNGHFIAASAGTAAMQLLTLIPGAGTLITSALNQSLGQVATQGAYGNTELQDDLETMGSQRNLANTYVWTVEGGFYAESTEVAEIQQETYANETSLSLSGGLGLSFKADIGIGFEQKNLLSSGSSFTLSKSKTKESSTSFGLDVSVDIPTSPRYKYAGTDGRTLTQGLIAPGTVDAYRFMSFYLEPKGKNFIDLFTKVVDPIWLDESPDPNAQALRQARGNGNLHMPKPCWRIMHRVTYVSRVLPEFQPEAPPSLEQSMSVSGIESNYMLVKKFEPYIANISDSGTFFDKIDEIIDNQLPEFAVYKQQVKYYLALYFNID